MPLVYPRAEWTPSGTDGGSMLGGSPRCVWHTTETSPSAFFTAKTYYHMQIREWAGQVHIRQFIDFARASRALRREDATHTNRRGTFCPNVALVAYAKDSAGLSDAMVNEIGAFVAFAADEMGVSPEFPLFFRGGESYGYDGVGRMSATEWTAFTGHCGHQHVYRNTHWDPGRFPVDRILASLTTKGDDLAYLTTIQQKQLADFIDGVYAVGSNSSVMRYIIPWFRKLSGLTPAQLAELEESAEIAAVEAKLDAIVAQGGGTVPPHTHTGTVKVS